MENFEDIVKTYVKSESIKDNPFNPLGKCYYADTKFYTGYYWYYENDDFIIDIHNLFIREDFVEEEVDSMKNYIALISNFVISGNGEWFAPYQSIEPFSMLVMDPCNKKNRYLLHKNSRLFLVGIKFKNTFFEKHAPLYTQAKHREELVGIFFHTKNSIVAPISKIAKEILTCTRPNPTPFFEEKVQEWFATTIQAQEDVKSQISLSPEDERLIDDVSKYISDHYASHIGQPLLEKIACMGGTKLKQTFKKKYHLSITEFTQVKRMNMAEQLLLNTDLHIKHIAKTVGYTSPSRFSKLYKRYKGVYPIEVKKMLTTSK